MMNRLSLYLAGAWLLLLAGCASVTPPPTAPAPASSAPQAQQPGTNVVIEPATSSEMSGNRAVVALLDHAQADIGAGRREAAEGSLERALRIEPRNPWLWHQLAQLRLDQGQYAQAITLARKSNSFAGQRNRLLAGNWQVIGKARVAKGDSAGAEDAFKRAADYAQKDQAEQGSGFFHVE